MTRSKHFARLTSAALLVGLVWGATTPAESAGNSFSLTNNTKNAIWITTYRVAGENGGISSGCALPGTTLKFSGSAYGFAVYVRGEVKKSATSCADHDHIYDLKNNYTDSNMGTFTASQKDERPRFQM